LLSIHDFITFIEFTRIAASKTQQLMSDEVKN